MEEISIQIHDITSENISPFGSLIDVLGKKPNASSSVFDYWDALGEVAAEGKISFGMVKSHPGPLVATNLERHLKTSETLIPLTGDIDLVVSEPTKEAKANLASVAAIRVPQGKAVILKPGTWHYVPMNADKEVKTMVIFRANTPIEDLLIDDFSVTRGIIIRIKG